jgi:hypothetical protein
MTIAGGNLGQSRGELPGIRVFALRDEGKMLGRSPVSARCPERRSDLKFT